MKTTISLNSFIVSKIEGTVANHTHLEKKKFYVLIDLIVHQSQYNEGKYAYLIYLFMIQVFKTQTSVEKLKNFACQQCLLDLPNSEGDSIPFALDFEFA